MRLLQRRPFQQSRCSTRARITAAAGGDTGAAGTERRSILLTGAALLAAPLVPQGVSAATIKKENLSGFQRADQRSAFQQRVVEELRKVLTKDDAPDAARAVLNDAGTYDVTTSTGGFNGSLRFELDRTENRGLKAYFDKLTQAKEAIDAKSSKVGIEPIGYADLESIGLKVATRLLWLDIKIKKSTLKSGGETIADQFGAAWDVTLGRKDADSADPEGRLLQSGASPQEIKDWFFKLGNTKPEGGFGVGKAPFWERPAFVVWTGAAADQDAEAARLAADETFTKWKRKYDRSKATVTRTDYEVDFIQYFDKLQGLGVTKVPQAYLVDMQVGNLKL